jgi:hypothetical protein
MFVTDLPLSLFRGHETTASVMSFAIGLLATHPEEQEELYKHVRSVVPDGRLPVRRFGFHYSPLTLVYQAYQDVPKLTRVLAVINETLRLFPPVSRVSGSSTSGYCNIHIGFQAFVVMKEAAEDCVITTDSGKTLPVPKGTELIPMINAIHHNRTWECCLSYSDN